MYIPQHFRIEDRSTLTGFMARYNFATLITAGDPMMVTHLPFIVRPGAGDYGTLVGHMAKANGHWTTFRKDQEVLIIFQGPHGYVSPSWYADYPSVPTWNYMVVHAYGMPKLIGSTEARGVLEELVSQTEAAFEAPWSIDDLPDDFTRMLTQQIVAFEVHLTRVEGKFKLGQNRSELDREKVAAVHDADSDSGLRELGAATRRTLKV